MKLVVKLLSVLFVSLSLGFASCGNNQDDAVEEAPIPKRAMEQLFDESLGLPKTSADSVTNFAHKFCNHMNKHGEDINDEYFQPIIDNTVNAAAVFGNKLEFHWSTVGIKINTEWDGEYHVNF